MQLHRSVFVIKLSAYTPDPVGIRMIFIETQFIRDIQPDQQTASDSYREPEEVDKAEAFIAQEVAQCDFDVVGNHVSKLLLGCF
jgi:hypothetical protein